MQSQPEGWPKEEKIAAVDCAHPYTGNQVGLVLKGKFILYLYVTGVKKKKMTESLGCYSPYTLELFLSKLYDTHLKNKNQPKQELLYQNLGI